jgi:hypothetical protein
LSGWNASKWTDCTCWYSLDGKVKCIQWIPALLDLDPVCSGWILWPHIQFPNRAPIEDQKHIITLKSFTYFWPACRCMLRQLVLGVAVSSSIDIHRHLLLTHRQTNGPWQLTCASEAVTFEKDRLWLCLICLTIERIEVPRVPSQKRVC